MLQPELPQEAQPVVERRPPPYLRRAERPHAQPMRDVPFDTMRLVHRVVAVGIWLLACVTTGQFIAAFGVHDLLMLVPAAILAQAFLTVCELPFWGRRRDFVAGVAVVADTIINASGFWLFRGEFDDTPPWRMLAEAFGLDPRLSLIPALMICLVFGYVLAAAPERVWNRKL